LEEGRNKGRKEEMTMKEGRTVQVGCVRKGENPVLVCRIKRVVDGCAVFKRLFRVPNHGKPQEKIVVPGRKEGKRDEGRKERKEVTEGREEERKEQRKERGRTGEEEK
jgi:hypothetical protein